MTDENDVTKDMMKERVLTMFGDFDETNCQTFLLNFLKLIRQDDKKDIIVYIDSYGGYAHSFFQLYDAFQSFKGDVHTIVTGKAMSAGAFLLLSGTKGKRFAYPHATIMVHELAFGMCYNKLHQQESRMVHTRHLQKMMNDIVCKHTKLNKKQIEKMLKVDTFLNVKEAKKMGIIDEII